MEKQKLKNLIILLFLVIVYQGAQAQRKSGSYEKYLNFGVGFNSAAVPVYAGVDFGIHPDITLGPQAEMNLNFHYLWVGAKSDYHFNKILNIPGEWDVYAGLNLGFVSYTHLHGRRYYNGSSGLVLGMQIGGRYYWNSVWGINFEIGGGSFASGGRIGLTREF